MNGIKKKDNSNKNLNTGQVGAGLEISKCRLKKFKFLGDIRAQRVYKDFEVF